MNARSLVGMTEGAKKRRARSVAERRGLLPIHLYEELRVGERLRPCRGCKGCSIPFSWPEDRPWAEHRVVSCGGSGVLPARPRRFGEGCPKVAADDSVEGETYFVVPAPDERPCGGGMS